MEYASCLAVSASRMAAVCTWQRLSPAGSVENVPSAPRLELWLARRLEQPLSFP